MIILLFGPPGCGKGTQAALLVEKLHIPAISTGEMFRTECQSGSELGKLAHAVLKAGGLVGDDVVNKIVASRISRPDCAGGFLLDGYPRTVPQAQYFSHLLDERGLPGPIVIHLEVPHDELVGRLTARRQCPRCKRIYNVRYERPRLEGVCDQDGTALFTREDDSEPVIRERLRAYDRLTGPVLDWYGGWGVRRIDASLPPQEVAPRVAAALSRDQARVFA